jgi:SecD/SecF fusion protein
MNLRPTITFVVILLIIGFSAYALSYGADIGDYDVVPVKDLIKYGLDLRGGVYVVLEANAADGQRVTDDMMDRAVATIRRRVDALGVSEPLIARQGNDSIRVELPDITDTQRAIDVIGKTAQLKFVGPDGQVVLTGDQVKNAEAVYQQSSTGYNEAVVSLELNSEGAKSFEKVTAEIMDIPDDPRAYQPERAISIVLDEEVISAPEVQAKIVDGRAVITGMADLEDAADLATLIKAGALPVDLEAVEVRAVGPTLGANSLALSIKAGGIGILLVMLFMLLYYRIPGLVADIALAVYIIIVLLVLVSIKATLTLPGIAGLILSIGMAVDANVIIFERLKEELHIGKSLRTAINSGFSRAFTAILDSNITTLIAAAVLFYFGSGPIKGFAVTLSVGILASMFTAIIVTKMLLRLMVSMNLFKDPKMYAAAGSKERHFKIVEKNRIWFGISAAVIAIGLVMAVTTGLNLGIDFTGGTLIEIDLGKSFTAQEIMEITDRFDTDAAITYVGEDRTQVQIKTKLDLTEAQRGELFNSFKEKYDLKPEALLSEQNVGPTIGDQLKRQALLSVVLAGLGILIYITFRFEFRFGVAAVIAFLHDVLVVLAIFAVFKLPINSSFIAAILTIVGYSINATIVIFDRVRENRALMKKMSLAELVNVSVSQTMARSINTSLTTLITISMVYIMGVESIKEFALPIIAGLIAGAYSSMFVAGPLWAIWKSSSK